jgi:hypothetical protein
MLDSFTSDSILMMKSSTDNMSALVYLNEDGSIDLTTGVAYLYETASDN